MPLDIAWSFFLVLWFFLTFWFLLFFFFTFFLIFLSLFVIFYIWVAYGGGGLDTLGVVIHAPALPLLPFSLPITIGFVPACRATALMCHWIFPEFLWVGLKHRCQCDPWVVFCLLIPRFVYCSVVWSEDVVVLFWVEFNGFLFWFGIRKRVFRGFNPRLVFR